MDPTQDELDARRQAREGSISAEEQAGAGELPEEDDGQLFAWESDRKVTLGTLTRGLSVEHAFVFTGKRLKGSGGLPALDDDVLVLVRGRVSKVAVVPTRDDDENAKKATTEVSVAPKVIILADSDEAMALLAPIIEKRKGAAA